MGVSNEWVASEDKGTREGTGRLIRMRLTVKLSRARASFDLCVFSWVVHTGVEFRLMELGQCVSWELIGLRSGLGSCK